MRKSLILVAVLFGMLWQSLAIAGSAVYGEDFEHTLMHWSEAGHHHHDDGSFHEADSDDASQHVALDAVLSLSALLPSMSLSLPPADAGQVLTLHDAAFPSPSPHRLRRPPRLLL
ncbi:conserved hypothetical protein [Delftia acidovorans SPH-1]|uniref:Cobalt transporter n=1 Tax=Delftia acidovorans (strain DSM 14801 / SPH-1) TaxID=398578 RepID=A9BT21_DELAS|nr:conserved hypothetical protein [Delftia acidovorans SPH-1]